MFETEAVPEIVVTGLFNLCYDKAIAIMNQKVEAKNFNLYQGPGSENSINSRTVKSWKTIPSRIVRLVHKHLPFL